MNNKLRILSLMLMLIIAVSNLGSVQAKDPISFEGILRLPDFGLNSNQIADQIAESGLAFEVTKAHIDSLRQLGFDSSVINAVRQFYRMGTLKIATIPAQVEIFIDNEAQGISDAHGIWEKEIPRGIHNVKLEKKGYTDKDTSITITKNKTLNLKVNLQKSSGTGGEGSKFYGRYGASLGYGISMSSPTFDDDSRWKSGNNTILSLKANVLPYLFVDLDINGASFNEFDSKDGDDYGSLSAFSFTIIPGVYKEFNDKIRGYLGLGIELNSTKIENGKYVDDGLVYVMDEKGSKSTFALLAKLGADAFIQENLFLFVEYRTYSVLGQYAMSFIAIGAGIYLN